MVATNRRCVQVPQEEKEATVIGWSSSFDNPLLVAFDKYHHSDPSVDLEELKNNFFRISRSKGRAPVSGLARLFKKPHSDVWKILLAEFGDDLPQLVEEYTWMNSDGKADEGLHTKEELKYLADYH
eukprot:NODE_307_length_985_cov_33.945221_g300_i0.p1 GENE.NODE_307_length_985_cov_33.945221_g300_i0~~NODE_307_length_985_cov_33.945221_g300_i0.p1  ORF type:complete len:126 (+),score=34.95 NODE_307_length_985_cov_33.945221_g300_i0:117-494(+)